MNLSTLALADRMGTPRMPMWKRALSAVGVALGTLLPTLSYAQTSDDLPADCAAIKSASAISPYVKMVLERAEEGLKSVSGGKKNSGNFDIVFPGWIQGSFATVASTIDMQSGVLHLRPSLRDATTCLHLDERKLQCALAEARKALITEIGAESIGGIMRAQELIQFLQERLLALQEGADDGTWLDVTALNKRLFDTRTFPSIDGEGEAVCGDNKRQASEECEDGNTADGDGCSAGCLSEMCPYTSDYSEPIPSRGLGCDLFVLEEEDSSRKDATSVITKEVSALQELMDARDTLMDTDSDPEHVTIEGCVRGWCESDEETPCGKSSDCGDGGRCIYGRRVCAKDATQRCSSDEACGEFGPCTFVANTNITTPRGAFSLQEDASRLTLSFIKLWQRQGLRRAWPEEFRNPADFPLAERAKEERRDRANSLGRAGRLAGREALRADQEVQGIQEGLLFATALDGHLEIATELLPLRDGVRRLGLMAQEQDGTRQIARNLAYYLLRTCIHRPCNEKLLQILRVTYADECFPYTNGEYLTSDAWEACVSAAEL